MLVAAEPALVLAPMEGVTDAAMRAVQGEIGAFSYAVAEFLRVNQNVPPRHVFFSHVPELRNGARTPTGLPVQVQLLGGDPDRLAAAAAMALSAGATAIDLNFGCPARTVNRHDGGATLLKHPKRIRAIVAAVRAAVPREVPVSAKVRLGWDSVEAIDENAEMVVEGGASWLTIHARTREQGYAPPVDWGRIGRVRERLPIPVVANGDIWDLESFRRCRIESGCRHFMLGRGALADPSLAGQIARELGLRARNDTAPPIDWIDLLNRLAAWTSRYRGDRPDKSIYRIKQWLNIAARFGRFRHFEGIKHARGLDELLEQLRGARPGEAYEADALTR